MGMSICLKEEIYILYQNDFCTYTEAEKIYLQTEDTEVYGVFFVLFTTVTLMKQQ